MHVSLLLVTLQMAVILITVLYFYNILRFFADYAVILVLVHICLTIPAFKR